MSDETENLARRIAESFDAHDPSASFARLNLTLSAHPAPLQLPGKTVYGVWDPLLRRVELHACDDAHPDTALVYTLAHELGHALHAAGADGQAPSPNDEPWADNFAQAWLRHLGPERLRICAAALRAQAAAARPDLPP